MERERQNNNMNMNHDMNMVTFRSIPRSVVSEIAKHLDGNGDANWEALADWFGLNQVDIRVIIMVLLYECRGYLCMCVCAEGLLIQLFKCLTVCLCLTHTRYYELSKK